MTTPQAKSFIAGAVLGAVLGALFLAGIAHLVLIGLVVAGLGVVLHRTRRLILGRTRADRRLKA